MLGGSIDLERGVGSHNASSSLSDLAAFPESINILPMVDGDPRTSENLIDGVNDTDRCVDYSFI